MPLPYNIYAVYNLNDLVCLYTSHRSDALYEAKQQQGYVRQISVQNICVEPIADFRSSSWTVCVEATIHAQITIEGSEDSAKEDAIQEVTDLLDNAGTSDISIDSIYDVEVQSIDKVNA